VRLLLDTHELLWWLFDDPELSSAARAAIVSPANEIVVSAAWARGSRRNIGMGGYPKW
jgi:PIN domain nuclease of toxin-antitoxin system